MEGDKILWVEGNDDVYVLNTFITRFKIEKTFKVESKGGVDSIKKVLPNQLKSMTGKTLGVIIDADVDIKTRWQSIKNILLEHKFNAPKDFPIEGLILINENEVRVGVWIMPNNNLNGMLEDFMALLIPNDDKLLPIVSANIDDIERQKLNKYKALYKSKAIIHSWLALQEEPGKAMGQAITNNYLANNEAICKPLINWLNNLFNNEVTDTHTTQ